MYEIRIGAHNEVTWTYTDISEITIERIRCICNTLMDVGRWSRQVKGRNRKSVPLLLKEEEFVRVALSHVNKDEPIPCSNSYQRLICYVLADILGKDTQKVVKTEYVKTGCKNWSDECKCPYIHRKWKNIDGEPNYEDTEMFYWLPYGRIVAIHLV